LFFRDAKLGSDGGYRDRWVRVEASQSLFIFRIGERGWRQRAYTICITSRPSMKQIGPGSGNCRVGNCEWLRTLSCGVGPKPWRFGAGLVVAPRRLFRAFLRGRCAKTNLYKSGFDESRLNVHGRNVARSTRVARGVSIGRCTTLGWFLLSVHPSVLAWLPLPLLTVQLFWLIIVPY